MILSLPLLLASFLASTQPATPPDDPLAPIQEPHEAETPPTPIPPTLPQPVVMVPKDWPGVFSAIRASQWSAASAGIAALPRSPLTALARAQLYTAKGSPPVTAEQLLALLAEAPELPQADQLQRMALGRGAVRTPPVPRRAALVPIGSTPRRGRSGPVTGEPEVDRLRRALEPYVKADDAAGAEALLTASLPLISAEARAELGQRVAWIYYVRGENAQARRLADLARGPYTPPPLPVAEPFPEQALTTPALPAPVPSLSVTRAPTGPWSVQAEWVSGLASWRLNDCDTAARAFREVGQRSSEASLAAAGYYWSSRAEMACRRPAAVQPLLRLAARNPETFYGMIARRALWLETKVAPLAPTAATTVARLPNITRAEALVQIGERDLAGELLRHQARIGAPADQTGLVAVARRLELAATQHFLGHFGQPGARVPAAARYPAPSWAPREGWRIDPSLGLAHALQESSFRSEAVSQAGAVGLMQVLPTTRDLIVRSRGLANGNLKDPATNMSFGQAWIEWMRTHQATGGRLPKVIASYNAGPLPVGRWQVNDRGDPLLWIESMPFWETRFYVPAVMRNLWVYQGFAGTPTVTLGELAQHRWPSFPEKR
ncbi:lytic transglycosylase domain-containing protein [Sphingomonas sp. LHG3406-1]|uniref:lytic transglycosylase domain-containing protein n=1 Tax=Sphingomonas sp. LHG3406-1 TaxID=2804617 RepID=UPI002624C041|nr:lytic transglycosylase domain-containing protein [Sphingomonas sp. LHG3406-1]